MSYDFHTYDLPFVDKNVILKNHNFSAELQPNASAAKNVRLFDESDLTQDFGLWLFEVLWGNTFDFNNHFSLRIEVKGAIQRRITAPSYAAYLQAEPDSRITVRDDWKQNHLRTEDFIHAGAYVGAEGTIRF